MRKFIFKNEIDHVFHQYGIDETERDRIKSELFIHPFRDGKVLNLKSEISRINDFDKILNRNKNGKNFSIVFKSLFEVNEDLKMPADIKKLLLDNSPVAVFIGAGVSKLLKYPLWGELANNAFQFLLENGRINHTELYKLNSEIDDPKQKLSIFERFCPRNAKLGQQFYKTAFEKPKNRPVQNPYDPIVSPYLSWVKITSNIEYELLDALYERELNEFNEEQQRDGDANVRHDFLDKEEFKRNRIVSENFSKDDLNIDQLYHLHGEFDALEKTIFTTEDYIENYFSQSKLKDFLEEVFNSHTVIFMGYGLAEFPILESVMNQSGKEHYALMASYFNESNIFSIKERYYSHLNITPIPYYIDFKGYARLYDVLESWEREIRNEIDRSTDSYFENLDSIDEVL